MILLHNVIQILALPQATTAAQRPFRLECFDCRRIRRLLIQIDYPRLGITRCAQSLTKEAFRGCRIALGGEQKFNGLPGRIHSPMQELVLALNLYICLADAVAIVSRLQMLTTSLVQLWRIRLDPTPDAAGIYRYPVPPSSRQHARKPKDIEGTIARTKESARPGIGVP